MRFVAGNLLQHQQRRIALGAPVGFQQLRVHDQPVAILHQQIAAVTQLRLLARPLARQLRVRIGLRLMGLVRALLAMKIHRRVAGIVWRRGRFCPSAENSSGSPRLPAACRPP
jgi:hypothetical protein